MSMATAEVPALSAEEARDLTERIRAGATDLRDLLLRAHEGRAWRALGYVTWEKYLGSEFNMRRDSAYRLIAQAKAIAAIAAATGVPEGDVAISGRAASDLGPEGVARVAKRAAKAEGDDRAGAIQDAVARQRGARTQVVARARQTGPDQGEVSRVSAGEAPRDGEPGSDNPLMAKAAQLRSAAARRLNEASDEEEKPDRLAQAAKVIQQVLEMSPQAVAKAYIDQGQFHPDRRITPNKIVDVVQDWARDFAAEVMVWS